MQSANCHPEQPAKAHLLKESIALCAMSLCSLKALFVCHLAPVLELYDHTFSNTLALDTPIQIANAEGLKIRPRPFSKDLMTVTLLQLRVTSFLQCQLKTASQYALGALETYSI